MPSSFNNNKGFSKGNKDKKLNRSAILTVLAVIVALITVIGAAVIANREKEPIVTPEPPISEKPIEKPTETPTEEPTQRPTEKPSGSTEAGNKLPSFVLPVSGTLSNSHDPDLQVFSPTMNDYRVHLGIDLVTKENAPVYAAADGKISKIWVDPMMGYCMALSHSGNCVTVYKNLAELLPE
jgi:murein DD-endopeptidase MepM/ murein hydrolase activator NlpD